MKFRRPEGGENMAERLTRREALKWAGATGVGVLGAVIVPAILDTLRVKTTLADIGPIIPTPEPTSTPIATATVAPRPTEVVKGPIIERDGIKVTGVPEKIDSSTVDVARGQFKNTIGLGAEGFIAEPGGLLVGPDFGSKSAKNPFGENPVGWDAMYDSGGSIKPFSSVSQEVFRFLPPAFQNLPEGGFILASAGVMVAKVGEAIFDFRSEFGKNYFFLVRGIYPDGKQDSDLNRTVEFTNYKPGHILVNMYESREQTNTAFVSEGQFLQMARTSHSTGTNCGAEGCSRLKVAMFDVNTKALTIIEQVQGRFVDPRQGWQPVFRNW